MTFKLTQEQIDTIQEVFDNQRPGKSDYDCWEGINKQLQTADEQYIKINEEGKEELLIFYMKVLRPDGRFSIEKVRAAKDSYLSCY